MKKIYRNSSVIWVAYLVDDLSDSNCASVLFVYEITCYEVQIFDNGIKSLGITTHLKLFPYNIFPIHGNKVLVSGPIFTIRL